MLPVAGERHVIAIGNFDGGHIGHAKVAHAARALAQTLYPPIATMALTFAPHPRRYFQPDAPFFPLSDTGRRAQRLAAIGFDRLAVLPFDAALAGMSADDFVTRILLKRFNAAGVVVGADFHFGKGRTGTPQFLDERGKRDGFSVCFVTPARDADGAIISSSAIRAALEAGDIAQANRLLGYSWSVSGEVIHGEKLGRTLGYPTANIRLSPDCRLAHGIYAVRARVDGKTQAGVASFGRRPTFDNGAALLEVHLFDFSGDLYGKSIEITFEAYLRPELKFETVQALITQMNHDSARAKRHLSDK